MKRAKESYSLHKNRNALNMLNTLNTGWLCEKSGKSFFMYEMSSAEQSREVSKSASLHFLPRLTLRSPLAGVKGETYLFDEHG
jgi:hypothetical protein